jgi:hypothetical protein
MHLLAHGNSKRGRNMQKIMTVVLALPLLVAAYGMSAAKDVAVEVKPGCPTGVVDRAIRKNIVPKALIAPIPAPTAARKKGGPKVRDKTPMDTSRLKKPAVGNGDCG